MIPTQKELERQAQIFILALLLGVVVVLGLSVYAAYRDKQQDEAKWIREVQVDDRQQAQ